MNTFNNNTPVILAPKKLILAVCDRLEIPTRADSYAQHMGMAIESLKEEVDLNINLKTLSKYAERMRHCDFFDILYRILCADMTLEEAVDVVVSEYVLFGRYDSSEFYDFMFAVGRESQYFELEKEHNKEELEENECLIHSSHEIGGGKVGHVSIMNELRNDSGLLIDSWVEEIPTTPNIQNWESYLQKNGQTFLIANDDLYAFLEETGFEVGNGTPNGRGCSRHDLLLNGNPTLYSVDVYTPFEWYTDHKGNKFEDFEQSIGE